jgi:hypothetical protein
MGGECDRGKDGYITQQRNEMQMKIKWKHHVVLDEESRIV